MKWSMYIRLGLHSFVIYIFVIFYPFYVSFAVNQFMFAIFFFPALAARIRVNGIKSTP